MKYRLGFIGAGNMAEAIARAAIAHDLLAGREMIAADPSPQRRAVFESLGIEARETNEEVVAGSDQLLLAIKPQVMAAAAADIAAHAGADQVIVSIMAGIGSAKLAAAVGRPVRVVRVMPNTPMMAGLGMAGVALGEHAQPGDDALAMRLFGAGRSRAVRVPESTIDAVTAVSGSGPAYVFYLAEAMEDAARELGLGDDARLFVAQTLLGSAQLLLDSPDSPAELRRKVTSPGGTTEAAIRHLDGERARGVIIDAIKAAHRRSRELGA